MKLQLTYALLFFAWFVQFPLSAPAAEVPTQKRVLALYSFGKDFPSNVDFDRGVQAVLQKAGIEYTSASRGP